MKIDQKFFDRLEQIVSQIRFNHYQDENFEKIRKDYIEKNIKYINKERKDFFSSIIKVGLWGSFSCGKSSFINALLGVNLLPVSTNEATSTVTEIKYGKEQSIKFNYEKKLYSLKYSPELAFFLLTGFKTFQEIPADAQNNMSKQQFNEVANEYKDFADKIKLVSITLDNPVLAKNIIFYDLPGVDGSKRNSNLTEAYIDRCDIVLYLKSSDRPLDKYDHHQIKRLRCKVQKRIIFAIRNKSDELFKSYYAEKGRNKEDIEIYKDLSREVFNDHAHANFDKVFLISSFAYNIIKQNGDNAKEILRKNYKSKFRFVKPESDIEVISGYKYFNQSFFESIELKKDDAKQFKLETDIYRRLEFINSDIINFEKHILNNKHITQDEFDGFKAMLSKIQEDFIKVKDLRKYLVGNIISKIDVYVKSNYMNWIIKGLESVNKDSSHYQTKDQVMKEIGKKLEQSIQSGMKSQKTQSFFRSEIEKEIKEFGASIELINTQLEDFAHKLHGDQKESVLNIDDGFTISTLITNSKITTNFTALDIGINSVIGGVVGGTVVALITEQVMEVAMGAMLEGVFGGMGIFTVARGAYNGSSNGDGLFSGMFKGVSNTFNAVGSLFGSEGAKIQLVLNSFNTPGDRKEFAQTIYKKTNNSVASGTSSSIATAIEDKLNDTNIIEIIENTIVSKKTELEEAYTQKQLDLAAKDQELKSIQNLSEEFGDLLREYNLIDNNPELIKKAA